MVIVHTLLSVAAARNRHVHQMDVHNAFPHGDCTKEVYMHPPLCFHLKDSRHVCRLKKSLYGLRQAPRY